MKTKWKTTLVPWKWIFVAEDKITSDSIIGGLWRNRILNNLGGSRNYVLLKCHSVAGRSLVRGTTPASEMLRLENMAVWDVQVSKRTTSNWCILHSISQMRVEWDLLIVTSRHLSVGSIAVTSKIYVLCWRTRSFSVGRTDMCSVSRLSAYLGERKGC